MHLSSNLNMFGGSRKYRPGINGKSNANYSHGHRCKMVTVLMGLHFSLVCNFVNKCKMSIKLKRPSTKEFQQANSTQAKYVGLRSLLGKAAFTFLIPF